MMTSAQTLDAVPGLTYRQLDYWSRNGLLPGVPTRTGSGIPREIPDRVLPHLRHMLALTNAGLEPRIAATIAADLTTTGTAQLGPYTLTAE